MPAPTCSTTRAPWSPSATAKHAGDLTTSGKRWIKPAAAITAVAGGGYVLSGRDGGLFAFGGAPYLGSFAGSQATVVGLAVACR